MTQRMRNVDGIFAVFEPIRSPVTLYAVNSFSNAVASVVVYRVAGLEPPLGVAMKVVISEGRPLAQ